MGCVCLGSNIPVFSKHSSAANWGQKAQRKTIPKAPGFTERKPGPRGLGMSPSIRKRKKKLAVSPQKRKFVGTQGGGK